MLARFIVLMLVKQPVVCAAAHPLYRWAAQQDAAPNGSWWRPATVRRILSLANDIKYA